MTPAYCGVVGCGRPACNRFLPGPRCEEHAPAQPPRRPSSVASPGRQGYAYGTATTDPPRLR